MTASARPGGSAAFPRSRVALANGLDLAVADLGPADGPALVLLHGLTNTADTWRDTVQELRRLRPDLRIIVPDLRGHGSSSLPPDPSCGHDPRAVYSIDSVAEDIVQLLDSLEIAHADVAGHSMGALIAQHLGLTHPDRITTVIAIASTSVARKTVILRDWLVGEVIEGRWRPMLEGQGVDWPEGALSLTPLDADPDAVAWLEDFWCVYPISPQVDTRHLAELAARLPLQTWLGASLAILDYDERSALAALTVPTLVLWGSQDPFFPRADQDELIACLDRAVEDGGRYAWKQYGVRPLPDSGLQVDEIGHNLTWEIPLAVAADIVAFLDTGLPTTTAYRTGAPEAPHDIVTTLDAAVIVSRGGSLR